MPRFLSAWPGAAVLGARVAAVLLLTGLPCAVPPAAEEGSSAEKAAPSAAAKGQPKAGKPAAAKAKPEYAADDSCALCHEDVAKAIATRLHGSVLARREQLKLSRNCQSCHGPSQKHLDDPTKVKPYWTVTTLGRDASATMCLQCHNQQVSPLEWRTGNHYAGRTQCWDCHSRQRPAKAHSEYLAKPDSTVCLECHREVEGLFRLNSHHPVVIERRIECSDCHKPHGKIRDRDVNDICRSCHTAFRGPYIFEHGVLSGRLMGGCTECHNPHGSPNPRLWRFNGRGLCLQCHADKATHFPGPVCWDCHEAIHGSNTTPLLFSP